MGKIFSKVLQVIGAIFVILIVGIALGVLMGTLLSPFGSDSNNSASEQRRIVAAAKTATVEGHPEMAFISAIGRYTDSVTDADSNYSIEWAYGWGFENAPNIPEPAEDSNTAPITFTMNLRLADAGEPDGYKVNQTRIFFEYDTEGMVLSPVGAVTTTDGETPEKGSQDFARGIIVDIFNG